MENFSSNSDYRKESGQYTKDKRKYKGAGFGVLIIVAGLLLLAKNTGFLDASVSRVIFSWEMLIIAIGAVNILWRQSLWSGIIMIAIGSFFLLVNFYHMPFSTWQIFLPAILILIGIQMIFGAAKWRDRLHSSFQSQTIENEDFFEDIAIFGGGERKIISSKLKGGRNIAIFGGSKLDLSHSNIESGDKPVIEVVAIFGGSTMLLPADWNVKIEVFNIFGGFSDKRFAGQIDNSKVLIIKGITIFGGGEIKSF